MARDLLTPVLDESLRTIHYFNGRVLYAEDLRREQETSRRRHELLGALHGEGVAYGLEVSLLPGEPLPRTVTIRPGLALNRKGQLLHLSQQIDLAIAPEVAPATVEGALFRDCRAGTALPDGLGPYLLTVSPAAEYAERIPYVGIGDGGMSSSCGRRFVVEGVQFRLVYLDPDDGPAVPESIRAPLHELMLLATLTPPQRARLRNLLAHWCLGTDSVPPAFARSLYDLLARGHTEPIRYGPLDALYDAEDDAPNRLTGCDVPLALLYWTNSGIQFVDMWAVRRRLHRRADAAHPPVPAVDRRTAECEAAFLQFQHHLADLMQPGQLRDVMASHRVRDLFHFLPPAGVVPVQSGAARGVTAEFFFDAFAHRPPEFVDGAQLRWLMEAAARYPPLAVGTGELLWLYQVRLNRQARDEGSDAEPYLVFASGHLPYQAAPRFDLARWDYSTYAT